MRAGGSDRAGNICGWGLVVIDMSLSNIRLSTVLTGYRPSESIRIRMQYTHGSRR